MSSNTTTTSTNSPDDNHHNQFNGGDSDFILLTTELLYLIGDFLCSIPGGQECANTFLNTLQQADLLPRTRSYLGHIRQRTPAELASISRSIQNYGLRDILQDWSNQHGFNALLTVPRELQRRPIYSFVDKIRLRQMQHGSHFSLATTMSKFEEIGIISGHTHEACWIIFDRTHTRLISGSNDWSIKIWCANTGWLLHSLRGHLGPVEYMTINRESTMLASGCHDGVVRIWNLKLGTPIAALRTPQIARHPDFPNASPDVPNSRINRFSGILFSNTPFVENRIIMACTRDDGCFMIWRWVRGPNAEDPGSVLHPDQPLVIPFKTRTNDHPFSIAMDPSGLLIAVGGSDGTIRVFSTGPLVRHHYENPSIALFGPPPSSESFEVESTVNVISGDRPTHPDNIAMSLPPLKESDILCVAHLSHYGPLIEIEFSEHADRLLAYSEDGQAIIWEMDPLNGTWSHFPLSKDPIDHALFKPPHSTVNSLQSQSNQIEPPQPTRGGRRKRKYDVFAVCWLSGDEYVVTANTDGYIRVFDARTKQLTHVKRGDGFAEGSNERPGTIEMLEPHPQVPDVFLSASALNGFVALWHRSIAEPLWSVKLSGTVCQCEIAEDGWTIAVSIYTNEFDSAGSQVTKIYAIARDKLVAPIEQYFRTDFDNLDHTTIEPTLFGSPFPYFECSPQYIRPRDQDVYDNQPPFEYRTSLPAGLPENQIHEEDCQLIAQARALVKNTYAHLVPNLMSQDQLLAHAKQFGRRTRPRQTFLLPSQGTRLIDMDPMMPLLLDVDDPDDEDYEEPAASHRGRGRDDDDEEEMEDLDDAEIENDELSAIFHDNSDQNSSTRRPRRRHRFTRNSSHRDSTSTRRRRVAESHSTPTASNASQTGSSSREPKRLTRSTSNQSQSSAMESASPTPTRMSARRLRSSDFILLGTNSSGPTYQERNEASSTLANHSNRCTHSRLRRSSNVSGDPIERRMRPASAESNGCRLSERLKRRHVVIDDEDSDEYTSPVSRSSSSRIRSRPSRSNGLNGSQLTSRVKGRHVVNEDEDSDEYTSPVPRSSTSGIQDRPSRRARRTTLLYANGSSDSDLCSSELSSSPLGRSRKPVGRSASSTPGQASFSMNGRHANDECNTSSAQYPEWMTADSTGDTFYYPQVGDRIAVFPEGFEQFIQHHLETQPTSSLSSSYYVRKRFKAMPKDSIRDYFCAIVRNVEFVPGQLPNEWQTRLRVYRLDIMKDDEVWYEGAGFVEFVLLLSRLCHVLEHTKSISVDDTVSVRYDDGVSYDAIVVDVHDDRVWNRFTVQYDGDLDSTQVCPWELDIRPMADNYDEELPRSVALSVKRLLRHLDGVKPMDSYVGLSSTSSSTEPNSLALINSRLKHHFYRHPQELAKDLERLSMSFSRRGPISEKRDAVFEMVHDLRYKYPLELEINDGITSVLDHLFPSPALAPVSPPRLENGHQSSHWASFDLEIPVSHRIVHQRTSPTTLVGTSIRSARRGFSNTESQSVYVGKGRPIRAAAIRANNKRHSQPERRSKRSKSGTYAEMSSGSGDMYYESDNASSQYQMRKRSRRL